MMSKSNIIKGSKQQKYVLQDKNNNGMFYYVSMIDISYEMVTFEIAKNAAFSQDRQD